LGFALEQLIQQPTWRGSEWRATLRWVHSYRLTCAYESGRVRVPHPIWSTHWRHIPSRDVRCVTTEEYLRTPLGALRDIQGLNGTILRSGGWPTTNWRGEIRASHDQHEQH